MRLIDGVSYLGRETLRIVLPSPCVVCGGELSWSGRRGSCCGSCWDALPAIAGPACRRCGIPWEMAGGAIDSFLCLDCVGRERDPVERIVSWGRYAGGLERLVHAFKFERHDFLDAPLASLLLSAWAEWSPEGIDAAVPVPLHRRKLLERGYNQADLLARKFAAGAGLRYLPGLLRREIDTPPQAGLKRGERAANVRRAFAAERGCGGRGVVLIDDVCTTGATLRGCARSLRRAGARRVVALTVARATAT
ncbi:MAG TPA: ComF family protein [Thermoanaerobaculia bacterium]|nr:ComF family protein [Thermoanaerobaculia bacterium]